MPKETSSKEVELDPKLPTLLLFDGHSMAHRAFHGTRPLSTASGQLTNMLVGFLNSFFRIYRDYSPTKTAVCFDLPEPTFRHKQFKEYKANRDKPPDEFIEQLGLLHEILGALGIPVVERGGFEADDLLATLAHQGRKNKNNVVVVTGDRDCFQLVADPFIKILYTPSQGSPKLLDDAGVKEKMGVKPEVYIQYAAMKGDTSDNLPGVAGVGEKTAVALIQTYGNIKGIYEALEKELKQEKPSKDSPLKPRVKESLSNSRDIIDRNLELMKLKTDVELKVKYSELAKGEFKQTEVDRLFNLLELKKFDKDLATIFSHTIEQATEFESVESGIEEADMADLLSKIQEAKKILQVSVAGNWTNEFEGFSLGLLDKGKCKATWIPSSAIKQNKKALKAVFEKANAQIIAHDIKPLVLEILHYGINIPNLHFDTRIAAYLIDPQDRRTTLTDLAQKFGGVSLKDNESGDSAKTAQLELQEVDPKGDSQLEVAALLKIYSPLRQELSKLQELSLYESMELPLVKVLAKMEHFGIAVDEAELKSLKAKLETEASQHKKAVLKAAGKEFNVNSTKELAQVLFEDLKLPPQKKTKTGYSTDAGTLEKLAGKHEIIEHLSNYRSAEKLRSTYGEGLLKEIAPDGRIHATFNQTVARTGRLSSDAPNLHNIPIRTEQGREFRKVFIATRGHELLVADYNQIELRCVAHLSGDPNLIEAFKTGEDIHSSVAARVFGEIPVPKARREQAKMISYGLMYGMEAFGLGQRLNIPQSEAGEILKSFFDAYPSIRKYMDKTVETTKKLGYTETLFGRRRYIPELTSGNPQVRAAATRQAMNSGIQGLAADIFKYALIKINNKLEEKNLESRLVLQVHDEVILEVPTGKANNEKEVAKNIVVTEMEGATQLDVPLVVEVTSGKTWADAKG